MTIKDFYLRFVSVRKCGCCREILSFDRRSTAFCPKCHSNWSFEKNRSCKSCFLPARECRCMPELMSRESVLSLRRLFFYDNEHSSSSGMRIIYLLKRKRNIRISRFVASELESAVRDEMEPLSLDAADVVVTWVPRHRYGEITEGFDQSQIVAVEIARLIGAENRKLFKSKAFAKEQKLLDKRSRLKNAKSNITLVPHTDVAGKYVILYDDMVTTGSSMAICASLLKDAGARGVLCFSMSSRQF